MRLLFVIPEFLPHAGGGIITFYRILLPELVKQGHRVRVLVANAFSSKFPPYESDGVSVDFLDQESVTKNTSKFDRFRAAPELRRHLASAWTAHEHAVGGNGYDVVETTDWGLLFAPWVVEGGGPPLVVQLHGSVGQIDYYEPRGGGELGGSLTRLLELQMLAVADELQANSQSNAREWMAATGRDVTYIPPAWSPVAVGDCSGEQLHNGLTVARIQYWKGPLALCEALRLLGDSAPAIEWIGRDTPYLPVGESMSAYLSRTFPDVWGIKLRPIGSHSVEQTAERQRRAAFCVVPSVWDVFNFSCVEAMGSGRVVICSRGAGASDLIADGENGFLFEANDAEALAASLDQLLSLPVRRREKIGQAARQTVLSMLNPAAITAQRIERYEALVARGRAARQVHAWVADAVRPQERLSKPLAFLDNLPLRELSDYAIRRGLRRVWQ